mgnify:FL=1
MIITEIIEKKRDGQVLKPEEIDFMINGLVNGEVADYQMTSFMMAVCCRGMNETETAALTKAMIDSGNTIDLSDVPGIKVDKHSTGGVGDTTTLVVAPLVAACGGTVAKMSGRGLAHSGGTLDKLESVPGVCVEQPLERFKQIVRDIGLCVIGQSADLDPADKRMYALRDVSGTVKSIPLIASSIMSKKLASGTDAIVLDVKTGNGAFMEKIEEAVELASEMVAIGKNMNKRTVALITDMSRPLGMAVGNGLEMREAIQVLRGEVPVDDQLVRVCFSLAGNMLKLSGLTDSVETAVPKLQAAIKSGAALNKLREMIERLGGDTSYIDEPDKLVNTRHIVPVLAPRSGYIGAMNAKQIGLASLLIGAGREHVSDSIDPAVGILMHKRYGDKVSCGEAFASMYVNDERNLAQALDMLVSAVEISMLQPPEMKLIYKTIE